MHEKLGHFYYLHHETKIYPPNTGPWNTLGITLRTETDAPLHAVCSLAYWRQRRHCRKSIQYSYKPQPDENPALNLDPEEAVTVDLHCTCTPSHYPYTHMIADSSQTRYTSIYGCQRGLCCGSSKQRQFPNLCRRCDYLFDFDIFSLLSLCLSQ